MATTRPTGRGDRGKQLIRMNLSRNSAPTLAVSSSRSFCANQRIFSSASKYTLIPYRRNFLLTKVEEEALCVGELIKKEDDSYVTQRYKKVETRRKILF